MRKLMKSTLGAALIGVLTSSAWAQSDYPSKPIEMVVGFDAGGSVDIVTRAAAPFLEKYLGEGTSIAVINRPGASGTVAAIGLSRAAPDGYTLMVYSYPAIAAAHYGEQEEPFKLDDFEFLGTLTADPHNLVVRSDSEYQTLEQFLDAAREHPGDITVTASGVGGAGHLALKVLEGKADISLNYVPAAGAAGTLTQVLGGHVEAGISTLSALVPYLKEGQMRILATYAPERLAQFSDFPTFREEGVDIQWGAIRGVAAPAGLPDDVRAKLTAAIKATMEDPEFIAVAEKLAVPLEYMDSDAFLKIVAADVSTLDQIWAASPWR